MYIYTEAIKFRTILLTLVNLFFLQRVQKKTNKCCFAVVKEFFGAYKIHKFPHKL